MASLTFTDARSVVLREVAPRMSVESVDLGACSGRILAEDVLADRDSPPFHRSMRDGFAVNASDTPGSVRLIGEVRAGQLFTGTVAHGQAVEIMTGAPLPAGADSVIMIEHCVRNADGTISANRKIEPNENVASRGSEAKAGAVLLTRGMGLGYSAVACLAAVGHPSVSVYSKPRVAILPTGDEIVDVTNTPGETQIRNSNAWSLAAQVERAGGIPVMLPIAPDTKEHTRALIEQALHSDLLLLSGGVSAGKYDIVEPVLAELGATFFFDRVQIQPGAPLVFGKIGERFFFGLPGNPVSTMVTFEIFARAAIQLLSGAIGNSLPLSLARLTRPFRHNAGMTRFLPAEVRGGEVTPVAWKGSGDIAALCRANAFLIAEPDRPEYNTGDLISVLPK